MREAKVCRKCEVYRPLSDFSRDSKAKDGLKSWCKLCSHHSGYLFRKRLWDEDPWLLQAYGMLHYAVGIRSTEANARRMLELFPSDMRCPIFDSPFELGVTEPVPHQRGTGQGGPIRKWNPNGPSLEHVLLRGMSGYSEWKNLRVISLRANLMLKDSTPADMYIAADWRYSEWKKRGFDKHGNHVGIRHRGGRVTPGADDDMATDHSGGDS